MIEFCGVCNVSVIRKFRTPSAICDRGLQPNFTSAECPSIRLMSRDIGSKLAKMLNWKVYCKFYGSLILFVLCEAIIMVIMVYISCNNKY